MYFQPVVEPADLRICRERILRTACKRGCVPRAFARMDGHSSGTAVTRGLSRSTREAGRRRPWAEPLLPLYDLAPGGACHAASVAGGAVGSYPPLSPLPGQGPVDFSLWRFP